MRLILLATLLSSAACLLPPPDDVDFDAAPDAQVSFRVGGTVSGMWNGAAVTLRLVATGLASETTTILDANGTFAFDAELPDAAAYTVTIDAQPVEHTCQLAAGEGSIADGDVDDVAVTCLGPAVGVTFSAPLPIMFDAETLSYDAAVSVVVQQSRFTFAAPASASIRFNDVVHGPGATTAPWSLALGANAFTMEVTVGAISRTYTFNINRGAEVLQYLYAKASNPDLQDHFGASVDVDGDTMVVGAPGEASSNGSELDDGAADAGAAYVFRRTGTAWIQEAYLKASAIDAGDAFGTAVAIAGDRVAVGAPGEDSTASGINGNANNDSGGDVGAVYTYVRTGSTWAFDSYIKPSNPSSPLTFGAALSMDGTTLAVGVAHPVFNIDGVWVFTRGSAWSQQAYLPGLQAGTAFGHSVSVDGDTLAIGASAHDSCSTGVNSQELDTGCDSAGAAYIYTRLGSVWSKQAYLKASNTDAGDQFGFWVAVDGDTLVVGAPKEDSGSATNPADVSATDRGAAYVFTRSGSTWGQVAFLKSSNVSPEFGRRVAIAGELLGVHARGGSLGGAVTLFRRAPTWLEHRVLQASSPADGFGEGIALTADSLIIGAANEDNARSGIDPEEDPTAPTDNDVGAAYAFR